METTNNIKKSAKDTYLSLEINRELFAISITKVLEVLQKQKVTPVPNAPAYVRGVLNFRGEIVPVFETRKKFNLPDLDAEAKFVIIILEMTTEAGRKIIGAVADEVKDVIRIPENEIKPVPEMSKTFNTEFLYGIARLGDHFLMLLNVDRIFSTDEVNEMYHQTENVANNQ